MSTIFAMDHISEEKEYGKKQNILSFGFFSQISVSYFFWISISLPYFSGPSLLDGADALQLETGSIILHKNIYKEKNKTLMYFSAFS